MYAIRNKTTNQWLFGTDYREYPYKQRTSNEKAMLFEDREEAEYQFKNRGCNKEKYEMVKVRLEIVGD